MAEKRKQNPIQRFVRETIGELRKVTWPTRQEATYLTLLVLATMIVVGAILASVEALSLQLMHVLFFK